MMEYQSSEGSRMLYPITDAAHMLGIGRTVVYELMNEGRIRSVRIRQRRLIPKEALDEFVAELMAKEAA